MKLFIIYNFCIGLSVYSVFGQSSNRKEDEWYKEQWPTQPYAFGYEIRDLNGNEQYRKEMSDGDRVTGSYGYLGPDGLYRHVEYIADENGFRAKIRTSEPGTANDNPSNVEIESNPIRVIANPPPIPVNRAGVTPGSAYNDINRDNIASNRNPSSGYRRDEVRRPPDRPVINPNQPPVRTPDSSRRSNIVPINRDRININRGTDAYNPNPIDGSRSGHRDDSYRPKFADTPDNIIPYRGANPKRPVIGDQPRGVSPQNGFDNQNIRPDFRGNPDISDQKNPNFARNPVTVRIPSSQPPIGPSAQPYDRSYDRSDARNRDRGFDDRRGVSIGGPDGRGYEVTTKGGATKIPPKDFGFIEATKGPINPNRPPNKFYDNKRPTAVFDDENDDQYEDQLKRRHDKDRNIGIINKPVFEDRDSPQKISGFVRNRYNTTRPEIRDGVKTIGPPTPPIRESFNKTLNGSSFDANQGRRDGYDKRPTKVFVTNGPISGISDKRVPQTRGDDRSFGAIDEQQRQQHIDTDYDDKNTRDGHRFDSDGIKGPTDSADRNRPQRPIHREQKPQTVDIRPYYGSRGDPPNRSQDPQKRPQHVVPKPRVPTPPYDTRVEQHTQSSYEDIPVQRDDEFPVDQQTERPLRPQVFQPLMPNHRPDRQPSVPRRPDRPYKPRIQPQDRPYVEQQHIEVQPYQTQNSATISSPVNTIPTTYKPIDDLENNERSAEPEIKDNPSLNTPLSPSSYIVTPFPAPVNESNIQIKPILDNRPDVYTVAPEVTQMEIPKFGTRIRWPEPPPQDTYEPIDEILDDRVNPQKEFDDNNQNDYQNSNQNENQNLNPNESPVMNPIDNLSEYPIDSNVNPNTNQQTVDNIEKDQYYYDDQTQDVESKDNPKSLFYTQTISHRSDENLNINSNPNSSSPLEISHKIMNVINWHKYDHIDHTGRQPIH